MYARIYKKQNNKYQIRFLNKHTKESTWKYADTLEEAINIAKEINVEYHTKYPGELPKGIYLDKETKAFKLQLWLEPGKKKHIMSNRDLEKVISTRSYMLKQILNI